MRTSRKIPFVTLTLALLITIVQILRSIGGSYEEFVFANLHHGDWETFYNQPWRMITSPFIHQNIRHYLENLVFLLLFGFQIERIYGWKHVLGAFFGALITGYVLYLSFMHEGIVGISGGVCGLFGFSLIANRRTPWWTTLTRRPLHILYSLNLLWAVVVDIADWVPFNVAHLNHIVGILFGMLFGVVFLLSHHRVWLRWTVAILPALLFASQFYSPWQVEWQLVQRQKNLLSENPDCQIKSIEQEINFPSELEVVNERNEPVAVYWLDYEGNPILIHWVGKNKSTKINSWVGHHFCIVDVDSREALQAVIVTEPEQTINIR